IAVARRLGIPVVLDMAENYPAMLRSRRSTGRVKPWDIVMRNPGLAHLIERWVVERVDAILVVVEESRDRLTALGVPGDRITLIYNTPPLTRLDARRRGQHPPWAGRASQHHAAQQDLRLHGGGLASRDIGCDAVETDRRGLPLRQRLSRTRRRGSRAGAAGSR